MLITGIILSILLLMGFTRFGFCAKRTADGRFRLILRAGFIRIDIMKWQERAKRKRKKKPDKPVIIKRETVKADKTMSREILKKLFNKRKPILRSLLRGARIDRLHLNLMIAGANDPCDAAMLYWRLHMIYGVLNTLINHNLRVKKQSVVIDLDFQTEETRWEGEFAITFSLGRSIAVLLAVMSAIMKKSTARNPRKAV